jgi:hypothetical protein
MGVSVRRTYRVEGRRDETHTIKTDRSPRSAAKTKEKAAGVKRRPVARPHVTLRFSALSLPLFGTTS